jgi:hypothetical protein
MLSHSCGWSSHLTISQTWLKYVFLSEQWAWIPNINLISGGELGSLRYPWPVDSRHIHQNMHPVPAKDLVFWRRAAVRRHLYGPEHKLPESPNKAQTVQYNGRTPGRWGRRWPL